MQNRPDIYCLRHGVDRHCFTHEAAHAVAAIDNDIEFLRVMRYDASNAPTYEDGNAFAIAAVEMLSADATTWVEPNRVGAFHYVAAGVLAEKALLGHELPGGFVEDINQWKRGVRAFGELNLEDIDALLGASMVAETNSVRVWVREQGPRIVALADYLYENCGRDGVAYADVVEFLNAG